MDKLSMQAEREVLADLNGWGRPALEYSEVEVKHGLSRGRIYRIALRNEARKTEGRIKERRADREKRQQQFLQEVMDATATATVLDFMDGLPDDSVDLFVTSPPYNQGKPYEGRMHFHYFLGWMLQFLSECCRTLKPGGVLCLQVGATKDDRGINYPLDQLLGGHLRSMPDMVYQNTVRWIIPHGLTPNRRLAERNEAVLVFSKGEPKTFNAGAARRPQKNPGKRAFKGPKKGQLSGSPLGAHPTDVWDDIPTVRHNHPERTGHEAQFPVKLAKQCVNLYSMPGDLVVDPFSGSGTVNAACVEAGRSFTGCDLSFEDLRAKRLAQVRPDLVSRLPGVSKESLAVWEAEAKVVQREAEGER